MAVQDGGHLAGAADTAGAPLAEFGAGFGDQANLGHVTAPCSGDSVCLRGGDVDRAPTRGIPPTASITAHPGCPGSPSPRQPRHRTRPPTGTGPAAPRCTQFPLIMRFCPRHADDTPGNPG